LTLKFLEILPIDATCSGLLWVRRLREGHAPENLSVVRKMALGMLKKAQAKMGIKNKRLKAAWDEAFLKHVLRDFLDS